MLEAIGKCGGAEELRQLSSIKTYLPQDSQLIAGQIKGLFELLMKGHHNKQATEVITNYYFDPGYNQEIRQRAGYYLMRGRSLDLDQYTFSFGKLMSTEATLS